ncbi:MAG: histone deacetylase family protein [Candidatus Bathyarchaeaceae archaeon]
MGLTYHEKFGQYDLGAGHPFRGDRFANVMRLFEEQGLLRLLNLILLKPRPASKQDLLRVHDEEYVNLIFRLAEVSQPYDVETPVSPSILEAAMLIIGGAIEAGRAIYEGKIDRAVALGCGYHHAGRNYGGGFCLFNDIAVLVEYLRENYGLKRALILDYDVHFGNGTSDIYYSDPDVLFISLHQDPRTLYPGTGFVDQIGEDAGEGYNVNVPLPPRTGDQTYLYALKEIFVPLAEEFKPEIVLANGGSDPHFADMLGNLGLTVHGFFELSRTIVGVAEKVCDGKLVLMVGSGYNPAVLPSCWYALTAGVVGLEKIGVGDPYAPPVEPEGCRRTVGKTLIELKGNLKRYWRCFR